MIFINKRIELEYRTSCEARGVSYPDVFVYVKDKGQPLTFVRFSSYEILNPTEGNDYSVREMQVDRSYVKEDRFPDYHAGFLRSRIGIFATSPIPSSWSPPPSNPAKTPIRIIANLIRAIDLPSGDEDGFSDPFVEFEHYGTSKISSILTKTLDPMWNERIVIDSYAIEDSLLPLVVNVFDSDSEEPLKKCDFLGRTYIKLPETATNQDKANVIPNPEWHELSLSSKIKFGKIMLSFQIVTGDLNPQSLIPLTYELTNYYLKFKLFGLRDFQSSGLFTIKKPYIKLNVKTLRADPTDSVSTNLDVVTATSKSGNSNANFSEIFSTTSKLPRVANMLPTISVRYNYSR